MYLNLCFAAVFEQEMVSGVCLFHCRFPYYIYLSGSRFKEAQEKGRKVSVDFRIQYFKGNLSFGCYVAFIKRQERETLKQNMEANGVGTCKNVNKL